MVDEIKTPTNIENISQLYDKDPTTQNVTDEFVEIDSPLTGDSDPEGARGSSSDVLWSSHAGVHTINRENAEYRIILVHSLSRSKRQT